MERLRCVDDTTRVVSFRRMGEVSSVGKRGLTGWGKLACGVLDRGAMKCNEICAGWAVLRPHGESGQGVVMKKERVSPASYKVLSDLAVTLSEHLSEDGPVDSGIWAEHQEIVLALLARLEEV